MNNSKTKPGKSFYYNPVLNYNIENGISKKLKNRKLNHLKSLKNLSFSGIISSATEEIKDLFEKFQLNLLENTEKQSDLEEILNVIALCLEQDPKNRPNIDTLLKSSVFTLNNTEELQAKTCAKTIFLSKSPEILISNHVLPELVHIFNNFTIHRSDETINLVQKFSSSLFFDEKISFHSSNDADSVENDSIKQNLRSPLIEILKKALKENVFLLFAQVSLMFFSKGDNRVIESFGTLIKKLLIHLNFVKTDFVIINSIFEVLLMMFLGENLRNSLNYSTKDHNHNESF